MFTRLWYIICLIITFPEMVLYMLISTLRLIPRNWETVWYKSLDARLGIIADELDK